MRIKSLPNSKTAGAFMHLVGKTVTSSEEVKEVCSQYLAIQNGADLKNPHPYAIGQCNYETGGPSARLSDVAKALNFARYGERMGSAALGDTPSQMIAAALSTGDLQKVISDAVSLIVMPSYDSLSEDIVRWTKAIEVKNFRPGVFSSVDVDDLVEIVEGSEAKHGTILGDGEAFKLKTFGRNILIHRHLLINNEFDVIANGVQAYTVAASRKDASLQYGVLNDNAVMEDGVPLFHDDHNNLLTGPVSPFTSSLGAAMAKLRSQPTVSGEKSNAKASIVLVPTELEADAYQAANQMLSGNNGKIEVISSAYLNENAWYVFANPSQYPVVGRIMLEGSKTPLLIDPASPRQVPLNYDGSGLVVRVDVNASALSHVGAVKVNYT